MYMHITLGCKSSCWSCALCNNVAHPSLISRVHVHLTLLQHLLTSMQH